MIPSATASTWREDFQKSFELCIHSVNVELSDTKLAARADGAREAAEGLNQTFRRFRQTASEADLLPILAHAAAAYSERSASILLDSAQARITEARGFVPPDAPFEISQAAAVMSAIETKDPVISAGTEGELSPSFRRAAMPDAIPDSDGLERVYLFPVVTAGSVRAILFATGDVQPAPLELIAEAAAMRLELLDAEARLRPKPQPEFVTLSPSKTARAWTDLPPNEQALHLKAQRFARVKVAEIRLSNPQAVREGQERAALYATLKPEIDAARDTYRKDFCEGSPTMVDYLYLELIRSLANDEDRLLGPDFPGRLV